MDKAIKDHSRSSFLKKLVWALGSIFSLGIIGHQFSKNQFSFRNRFKTVSLEEANEKIKTSTGVSAGHIKPEPPPVI